MKFAGLVSAAVMAGAIAIGSAAQAKLTPFDGARKAKDVDVVSLYTGPAGAEMERSYFTAPAAGRQAGRCTVQTFVFTKMRLAQACY